MVCKRGDLVLDGNTILLQVTTPSVESYKIFGMKETQKTKYALFYDAVDQIIEKKHVYWVVIFAST